MESSELIKIIDVEVHSDNTRDCHWIKSNAGPKKVIIKMSWNKDEDKILRAKKKLRSDL